MKKITEFLLNEVEEFKEPRDKLAQKVLGSKKISNSKTDLNFDVKTKKDTSKRASYKKGEDISAYENSNLNVREELTLDIIDLLNEVSKARLRDYNNKVFDSKKEITTKRMKSSMLATDKMFPKHAMKKPKVVANEEVELDEISKDRLIAYSKKISPNLNKNQPHGADKLRKRTNQENGQKLAWNKVHDWKVKVKATNEEVELDEISKGRLGAYIKSATHDVAARSAAVGRHSDRANRAMDLVKAGNGESYEQQQDRRKESATADKHFQKSWKRRGNIAKAVDKLTKEDIDNIRADLGLEEAEGKVTTTVWSNAGRHEWIINKGDKLHKRSGLIHPTRAKAISDLKKNLRKDVKEEVELDEISKDRLNNYLTKAGESEGKAWNDHKKSRDLAVKARSKKAEDRHVNDANKALKTRTKRQVGAGEAWKKLHPETAGYWKPKVVAKEEVEISEVSKDRLKAYVQKSKASWDSARDDYDNPKKRAGANKTMGKRMTGLDDAKKRLKEDANSNDHLIGAHNYLMSLSGMDRIAIHKKANNGDLSLKVKNQRNTINHILKTVPKDVLAKHAPEKFEESVGLDEISRERVDAYIQKNKENPRVNSEREKGVALVMKKLGMGDTAPKVPLTNKPKTSTGSLAKVSAKLGSKLAMRREETIHESAGEKVGEGEGYTVHINSAWHKNPKNQDKYYAKLHGSNDGGTHPTEKGAHIIGKKMVANVKAGRKYYESGD